MRRGGLLAARAALVAVARVLVGGLAWVPPAAGRVPALALASPLGGARSAVLVVALSGGAPPGRGGSYLPPSAPGLAQLLGHGACGSFSPCPLAPCPPLGGGGKRGITGRKIVTKETQEGCLSF